MSATIKIEGQTRLSASLRGLAEQLSGDRAREMVLAAGYEVQSLTGRHLRSIALSRHATAQRLGAKPTNHWAPAAEKVEGSDALSTVSGGVTNALAVLRVRHPGISRAFKDITVRPTKAKALTIPIHALAYGKRAGELRAQYNTFILGGKENSTGRSVIAMQNGKDEVIPLYVLVRSAKIPQDRTLLPTEEELSEAATLGVRNYLRQHLQTGGK